MASEKAIRDKGMSRGILSIALVVACRRNSHLPCMSAQIGLQYEQRSRVDMRKGIANQTILPESVLAAGGVDGQDLYRAPKLHSPAFSDGKCRFTRPAARAAMLHLVRASGGLQSDRAGDPSWGYDYTSDPDLDHQLPVHRPSGRVILGTIEIRALPCLAIVCGKGILLLPSIGN
jgi:hypothetical protein